jgi:sodium-dependent dicarboxylate transporter 2/3/5
MRNGGGAMSGTNQSESDVGRHPVRRMGFLVGVVAFALLQMLPAPASLSPAAWNTAAVVLLMALWWTTEAVPLAATAMLPLVLFPTLGVLSMPQAAAP